MITRSNHEMCESTIVAQENRLKFPLGTSNIQIEEVNFLLGNICRERANDNALRAIAAFPNSNLKLRINR